MKKRLRRLEARLPPAPEPESAWTPLIDFLTWREVELIADAHHRGWTVPPDELVRLGVRAMERRAAGPSEADVHARSYGDDDADVGLAFWQFCMALGGRHGYASAAADFTRFQIDRLTLGDVSVLVRLVSGTTTAEELDAAVPIIEKLSFDGTPLSLQQFGDLVLRGTCPPAPARMPAATMPTDGQ